MSSGYSDVYWWSIRFYVLDDHHLSDEQKICKNGIVPYPIYAAVDSTKLNAATSEIHSDIWFEFTPHEAGFFNPGAFVDGTLLGSKFENGKLKEKKNEKKMSYLRGLWGSAIANFKEDKRVLIDILKKIISHYLASAEKKGIISHKEITTIINELEESTEKTTTQELGWEFPIQHLGHVDLKDKNMTDKTDIQLADAGIVINSAYPLILRPERKVELILSFDFSEGDCFETIKKASRYCKENNLPFPEIDALNLDKDKENPEDCYIFRGNGGPTVMHFPLFNRVNCAVYEIDEIENVTEIE
ncbi:PLA2G4C: Cytosolic phospholipase A2 gamma [Crotalus adamanteus]|uniref:PLA2G4C: Cytosolic phospholipase A2 gamma n=1 Tax=Crotalus adamanteus TaxID=8729 RepID=A0AAW1B4U9_CROAD